MVRALICCALWLCSINGSQAKNPLLHLLSLNRPYQYQPQFGRANSSIPRQNQHQQSSTLKEVLDYTNEERRRFGLSDVTFNRELSRAAQHHASDMAEQGYFSHNSRLDGSSVADRVISLTDYRYTSVAENLYFRNPDNDPFEAVQGWMNSVGHRKNLLNPTFQDIGLGYAAYGTDHYYVQVFGSPVRSERIRQDDTHNYLLHRTNHIRQQQRLPLLKPSQELGAIAQIHAENLLGAEQLSERRSDGTSIFSWRKTPAYQNGGTAVSFFRQEPFHDPEKVVDSWLQNQPCYILDPRYTEVGLGYSTDGREHNYVQLFFGPSPSRQQRGPSYMQGPHNPMDQRRQQLPPPRRGDLWIP